MGLEHGGTQARGGGFAARARDADDGFALEQTPGEFGFGADFGSGAVFAQGQQGFDGSPGRGGAGYDEIHALEVFGRVFPSEDGHVVFRKPRGKIGGHLFRLFFQQTDVCTEFVQQTDGGASASARADDGDAATGEKEGIHDVILSAV